MVARDSGASWRHPALLAKAAPGSRLIFTFVLRGFLDGTTGYQAEGAYRDFVERHRVWHVGLAPEEVGGFLDEYGWTEREQVGATEYQQRYVELTGRELPVQRSSGPSSPTNGTVLYARPGPALLLTATSGQWMVPVHDAIVAVIDRRRQTWANRVGRAPSSGCSPVQVPSDETDGERDDQKATDQQDCHCQTGHRNLLTRRWPEPERLVGRGRRRTQLGSTRFRVATRPVLRRPAHPGGPRKSGINVG